MVYISKMKGAAREKLLTNCRLQWRMRQGKTDYENYVFSGRGGDDPNKIVFGPPKKSPTGGGAPQPIPRYCTLLQYISHIDTVLFFRKSLPPYHGFFVAKMPPPSDWFRKKCPGGYGRARIERRINDLVIWVLYRSERGEKMINILLLIS